MDPDYDPKPWWGHPTYGLHLQRQIVHSGLNPEQVTGLDNDTSVDQQPAGLGVHDDFQLSQDIFCPFVPSLSYPTLTQVP